MNRIVLLTHSGLGRGFLSVLEHIYGAVPDAVELREIGADSDLEWEKAQLRQRIGQLAPGEALLILTDLFGAPARAEPNLSAPLSSIPWAAL